MPQNLELKARISSESEAIHIAKCLHIRSKGILRQCDIYYRVPHGRLKLRIINSNCAELIYYNRPNKQSSRYSDYYVLPVVDPELMNTILTAAFGQEITVEKKRHLFLYKNARLHIDDVRGLGAFIEFEVPVKNGKAQAKKLIKFLSGHFKIRHTETIDVSYSDLLMRTVKGRKRI